MPCCTPYSGPSQFERDVLRERTVAGMRAAKKRGEHIGRPSALSPAQIWEAKKMLDRGESPNHVARVLRVSRSTFVPSPRMTCESASGSKRVAGG